MNTLNERSQPTDEPMLILRIASWFFSLVLLFVGLGGVALYYAFEKLPAVDYELLAYGVGITLFSFFTIYYITGRRVLVFTDRLVSTTRFSTRTALLDEVVGTEFTPDFFRIALESEKAIKVPWYLKNALRLRRQLNAMIEEREAVDEGEG